MTSSIPQHPMITRLKSGTIEKKNYAALMATFPKLQSLQLSAHELFTGGFSLSHKVLI